jgi:hypothetical protein
MPSFGPGGQDPWAPGGGSWPADGGTRGGGGLGGIGNRLSGLGLPRPKGPLIPALGAAAVIVVIAAVIVAVRGGGGQSSDNTPVAGPTASAPAQQQSNSAQQQAASQLAGLLSQSGGDRGDVDNAVVSVQKCGPGLPGAAGTLSKAAQNRRVLLDKLGNLPGSSNLSPAMIQHLTNAWQASAQADEDLARWAVAESHGCRKGKTSNNRFLKASYGPDGQATNNKQAFTAEWNPLAQKYGLPTYKWEQL